jgi:hypothetical protein
MVTSVEAVIAALDAFEPVEDGSINVEKLYELLDGFCYLSNREKAMQAMFALLERYPDAEFGSPGPLVHELELISGYELLLEGSLSRQPTDLTVWMLNRILNGTRDAGEHRYWMKKLNAAAQHPLAPDYVRDSAIAFIKYQQEQLSK